MKTTRIYTAAQAQALLRGTTPGPWRTYGNAAHDDAPSDAWTIEHDGDTLAELRADDRPQYGDASDEEVAEVVEADADLMAAAPDLAASVEHHAARAERAEADRDAAVAHAEELTRALRTWQDAAADATALRLRAEAERDDALVRVAEVERDNDSMRAAGREARSLARNIASLVLELPGLPEEIRTVARNTLKTTEMT